MNAKRYERAAIVVTAENAESKRKYDRAEEQRKEAERIAAERAEAERRERKRKQEQDSRQLLLAFA